MSLYRDFLTCTAGFEHHVYGKMNFFIALIGIFALVQGSTAIFVCGNYHSSTEPLVNTFEGFNMVSLLFKYFLIAYK